MIWTKPRGALVIGDCVRQLSDRGVEGLVEQGPGWMRRQPAGRICRELGDRECSFQGWTVRQAELRMLSILDAIYLQRRPRRAKEGLVVAWGHDPGGC